MPPAARLSLGLDVSTQSLSAILLDTESGRVVWNHSLAYRDDARLLGYGFEHDTLIIPPREPGEAEQPPRLFLAALDAMLDDLGNAGIDMSAIAVINTSGQQHGQVFLGAWAKEAFAGLHRAESAEDMLTTRLGGVFAYGGAPIWKTANTAAEAERIRTRAGGKAAIIERTGSDIPLRFSAAAQRKIALRYPAAYAATRHILQISSLIPAALAGDCAIPLDFGNACGTGLMNYRDRAWDETMLAAVADDLPGGARALAEKLPALTHPLTCIGRIARYFQGKYGLHPACRIIAGSGDNPQSKVLASGDLLSLGTSFVYMMSSPAGGIDVSGAANAMYDGLGRPFNFGCRTNGALTWDRLRKRHGIDPKDYAASDAALAATPPGSRLRFWHPEPESFPIAAAQTDLIRCDDSPADFSSDYAGIVDSALGLVYRYGSKISQSAENAGPVSVCGGLSASPEILRRIAAIWNRPVIQIGQAGAALGAAVAGAAALIDAGNESEREAGRAALLEKLRSSLYAGCPVIAPEPAQVAAYHKPNGYLDRLEAAFEALRRA